MKKGMMGDILMMTPVIRRIKTLYPKDKVYIFTDERLRCLFYKNPYIDGINEQREYDLTINFAKKYDSTIHENKIKFYFDVVNEEIDLKLDKLTNEDYKFDLLYKLFLVPL